MSHSDSTRDSHNLQTDSFTLKEGFPQPFGASLLKGDLSNSNSACNFAIYAPDAKSVYVCLYDSDERFLAQIKLIQRVGACWCGLIQGVSEAHLYGIRTELKQEEVTDSALNSAKLLIDPYAKSLNRPLNYSEELYLNSSDSMVPKAHILSLGSEKRTPFKVRDRQRVIYEAHVKGLSALHPKVPIEQRGTYLGACHPSIIKHLKDLGISSVQFLPLQSFMPEPFIVAKGLTNYWGYNPINYFAPEPRYAQNDALIECKQMIKTFTDEGFEVILDVVYNHTCESGEDGPVLSLKGLCGSQAYIFESPGGSASKQYANYSGCGNTLKMADSFVQNLVMDSLRYWVTEMGVSGFRFDLATVLGRDASGFKPSASFFNILKQDPVLKNAVLISEPWDIGPNGYQLGQYPSPWLEVNDKYRDVLRGFWRSDKGLKGEFATRLLGSRDIFHKDKRPMHTSVNHVTYHDGFTLHDLVTYAEKHNLANLEDNRDGHNHNLSANYGVEGETTDKTISSLREQQKRNLFSTLILSQGTPHILGGDELSRSQKGNNNAYCQDNVLNWFEWQLDEKQNSFLNFAKYVVNLRQSHPVLQQMNFADDIYDSKVNIVKAQWYRRNGTHKTDMDWVNDEHHCFALHIEALNKQAQGTAVEHWCFCFNSKAEDKSFSLDILADADSWKCLVDTSECDVDKYSEINIAPDFVMPSRSMRLYYRADTQ